MSEHAGPSRGRFLPEPVAELFARVDADTADERRERRGCATLVTSAARRQRAEYVRKLRLGRTAILSPLTVKAFAAEAGATVKQVEYAKRLYAAHKGLVVACCGRRFLVRDDEIDG